MIQQNRPDAVAYLRGGGDAPLLRGVAKFFQKPNGVLLFVHVTGLPDGGGSRFFALHIHEGKGCGGEAFSETGAHYNPGGEAHPDHAGDLPPLLSNSGEAFASVMTDRFRLSEVIGRTLVIHSGPDDFHTQPAGNAGTKIACGVIQRTQWKS